MRSVVLSLVLCGVASAQVLQRRTEPPPVHPESCRDHIALTRHTFLEASFVEPDPDEASDMRRLWGDFGQTGFVARICGAPKLAHEYDVILGLAELRRRENIADIKREKAQPPK